MTRLRLTTIAVALALGAPACTPFSLSPPARVLPLESSATLDEGSASLQASGGLHTAVDDDSGFVSVSAAYAPAEGVEFSLEGTYAYIHYDDERSPHLGAGRVGLKVAPFPHLAIVGGVGAGGGAHGAFVSPDLGVILAYENDYLVPWSAFRGLASLPVGPNSVTVTDTNANGMPSFLELIPPDTAGWQLSTGVRAPIRVDESTRIDVLGGVGLTRLYGLDVEGNGHTFFTAGFAMRLVLAP